MDNSNTNTVLIVIVLLVLVAFGVWWFTQGAGTEVPGGDSLEVNVPVPGSNSGGGTQ